MDVFKTLRELHEEKRRLDAAIAALESRVKAKQAGPRARRGRKSMSHEERLEVSRRMLKYWQARRAAASSLQSDSKSVPAMAGSLTA